MLEQLLARLVNERTPAEVVAAVDALNDALAPEAEPLRPFLSVIMRTQGTRIEPLGEALASLAAQSHDDFEVALIVHSDDPTARERVESLVAAQPPFLSDRLELHTLVSGGRSAPLNLGIEQSKGRYIAVFDDDDLLLDDWVAAFARSESIAGGRLLRARVGTQDVTINRPVSGPATIVSSEIRDDYPRGFDAFRHFQLNASPFMGWAFPRAFFTRIGTRFSTDLDLLEDWDVVLRGATLLGVHQIEDLTAVYRRWSIGDSSTVTSSGEGWASAEASLIDALDEGPVLLDAGSVRRIRQLLADADELFAIKLTRSWRLAQTITRVANGVRRVLPARRRGST